MKVYVLLSCDWEYEGYDDIVGVFSSILKAKQYAADTWDQEWNWQDDVDGSRHVSRRYNNRDVEGFSIVRYFVDGLQDGQDDS